jgi:hypothetical protein
MIVFLFWFAVLGTFGASGAAILIGGKSEKLGGLLLIGTMICEALIGLFAKVSGIHLGFAMVDLLLSLVCAIGFLFIAIRTASIWLAAAMMIQAVELFVSATHLQDLDRLAHEMGYVAFANGCTIAVAALLLVATLLSTRKRAPKAAQPAFTRLPA